LRLECSLLREDEDEANGGELELESEEFIRKQPEMQLVEKHSLTSALGG
jgi:hypothetical protein